MAGDTILVVDNDHNLLRLMQIRLEAAGHKVHLALSQAATLAGKYQADFYKLLRKHRLDPATFKEGSTPG